MPGQIFRIPRGLPFSALMLRREADGAVSFSTAVVLRVCRESAVDPDTFLTSEDNLAALIVAWYTVHRARGGAPDPVAEQIAREVRTEARRSLN